MLLVYFSSKSGNTHKFVARLGFPSLRIPIRADENISVNEKYALICPTYSDNQGKGAVPPQVIQFLRNPHNRGLLQCVVGSGNKNFGDYFAYSADVISAKCQVPIIHRFELSGLDSDVQKVITKLRAL